MSQYAANVHAVKKIVKGASWSNVWPKSFLLLVQKNEALWHTIITGSTITQHICEAEHRQQQRLLFPVGWWHKEEAALGDCNLPLHYLVAH